MIVVIVPGRYPTMYTQAHSNDIDCTTKRKLFIHLRDGCRYGRLGHYMRFVCICFIRWYLMCTRCPLSSVHARYIWMSKWLPILQEPERTKLICYLYRRMGQHIETKSVRYRVNCVAWFFDFQWICFCCFVTLCDFKHEANEYILQKNYMHAETNWKWNLLKHCVQTKSSLSSQSVWERARTSWKRSSCQMQWHEEWTFKTLYAWFFLIPKETYLFGKEMLMSLTVGHIISNDERAKQSRHVEFIVHFTIRQRA